MTAQKRSVFRRTKLNQAIEERVAFYSQKTVSYTMRGAYLVVYMIAV